jgi:hypothetical protein
MLILCRNLEPRFILIQNLCICIEMLGKPGRKTNIEDAK